MNRVIYIILIVLLVISQSILLYKLHLIENKLNNLITQKIRNPIENGSPIKNILEINDIIKRDRLIIENMKKDTFESHSQFDARRYNAKMALKKKVIRLANSNISNKIVGYLSMDSYDADMQKMQLSLKWNSLHNMFNTKDKEKLYLDINRKDARRLFEDKRTYPFYITIKFINYKILIDKIFIKDMDKRFYLNKKFVLLRNIMVQDTPYAKDTSWQDAIEYCNTLSLASYSDWRLPNKAELKDIYNSIGNFKNITLYWYWSSTSKNENEAWYMRFKNGQEFWSNKSNLYYSLCVRDI
ncbi:Putative tail fiber protein [hydrothermal vent metagenome]|uniref:Putative tail fiber protein n=1 Tax=hydrothermal vent metagenome TaxID=652676 RepID=A0A1W1ELF2_9ZZZZ